MIFFENISTTEKRGQLIKKQLGSDKANEELLEVILKKMRRNLIIALAKIIRASLVETVR